MAKSVEGRAHRVGECSWHLYVPARVGSDSSYPFQNGTGVETRVDIVSDGEAVLVSDGSLPEETVRRVREVLADAE